MATFIVKRLLSTIPLVLGVVTILFVLLHLTPGDPVQAIVGQYPVPDAYRAALTRQFHLDDPLWRQYVAYLGNLLHGNLGYSYANGQSVAGLVFNRLPNTILLAASGIAVSAILGIVAALVGGGSRRKAVGTAVSASALTLYSVPTFWLGQILIIVFAQNLHVLPSQGMQPIAGLDPGLEGVGERITYLLLPMIALCAQEFAVITRVGSAAVRDTLQQDYLWTAQAKGLSGGQILRRHVLRNSLIPVVTIVGYRFGVALAGTVTIETVFGWPGVGRLLFQALNQSDNQLIMGLFVILATLVLVINLLTDLLLGVLDPRIRTVRSR